MSSNESNYPLALLSRPVAAESAPDDEFAAEAASNDGSTAEAVIDDAAAAEPATSPEETLDQKLRMLTDLVVGVAADLVTSLFVCGRCGIGKTHTIEAILTTARAPWQPFRGHVTPGGLFDCFREYHDRVIFIDDVVKVLKNDQALEILLAALGSTSGGSRERIITYWRQGKHEQVVFTGNVIFASNVVLKGNALFDALLSRAHYYNFDLTDDEIVVLMRRIAAQGWRKDNSPDSPCLPPDECGVVTTFLIEECGRRSSRMDLRDQPKAFGHYVQHKVGLAMTHWKDMVRSMLAQQTTTLVDTPARPTKKKPTKAEQQAILAKVRATYRLPEEQLAAWVAETKMHPRTYRRRVEEAPPITV